VEPGTASCIFPCVDDPGARCGWKIHVKCPRTVGDTLAQPLVTKGPELNSHNLVLSEKDKLLDMTVVCSGILVGEKLDDDDETKKIMTFEILDHLAAAQHIGFAVGPFEHVDLWSDMRSEEADERLGASALKIHGYCLPGREAEVRNTCQPLFHAADEFTMTYGRYPYDSYKVCFVDEMIPSTVPLVGFSLCSSRLLFPEGIIDPELDVTRTMVHSLASQYFGVYIVPDLRTDTWLMVGIAYYMTDLYLAKLCGNNDYRFRIKMMADKLVAEDRSRPSLHELGNCLHLGEFEMEFMALKAPLVLFILDKRLTKSSNSASASLARVISRVISKANTQTYGQMEEVLSLDKFSKLCEKSSSYKTETFWTQWVYGSGCPQMEVTQRFNKKQLAVDITLTQTQATLAAKAQAIPKSEFWREFIEEVNHVYAGDVQPMFTGPMTIRIHEANGTPYEHTVEIRDDAMRKGTKLSIPYNTKYKRLKRSRRQKERAAAAAAAAAEGHHETGEETIVLALGDKLDLRADVDQWELVEWTPDDEKNMDADSYEWVRLDSDFEWIFGVHTDYRPWMYTSQLQQDRDVVAQQESLLYLQKLREHAMSATILARTLYDDRYYHGIRTMAAEILARQTLKLSRDEGGEGGGRVVYRGMTQLMRTFQVFFCYPDGHTPLPNDFSDKRQYKIQCAIIKAIAQVQHDDRHPREASQFLLEQLQYNNNRDNPYSDHFYVAGLLDALATSLTSTGPASGPRKADMSFAFDDGLDDGLEEAEEVRDIEGEKLLEKALETIERYRRVDEWKDSYRNVWTAAVLDCKRKLMKAKTIPIRPLDFLQYLHDGNTDVVQIKAFEALVDLGLMLEPYVLETLLCYMTAHGSPYMRDQLFKCFTQGLAGIAFGEHEPTRPETDEVKSLEDGLIFENDDKLIRQNQANHARRKDIGVAMQALKTALQTNEMFQKALWEALQSPVLGCVEKRNLLQLFGVLFDGYLSLVLTVKFPAVWTFAKTERTPGRFIVTFKQVPRPLKAPPPPPILEPPPLPPVAAEVAVAAAPKKIIVQRQKSFAPQDASISVAPAVPSFADSIAVQSVVASAPVATSPAAPLGRAPSAAALPDDQQPRGKKRGLDSTTPETRPTKYLKFTVDKGFFKLASECTGNFGELKRRMAAQRMQPVRVMGQGSITANGAPRPKAADTNSYSPAGPALVEGSKPAGRKPLPTGERKPLPSGPSSLAASAEAPKPPTKKIVLKRNLSIAKAPGPGSSGGAP